MVPAFLYPLFLLPLQPLQLGLVHHFLDELFLSAHPVPQVFGKSRHQVYDQGLDGKDQVLQKQRKGRTSGGLGKANKSLLIRGCKWYRYKFFDMYIHILFFFCLMKESKPLKKKQKKKHKSSNVTWFVFWLWKIDRECREVFTAVNLFPLSCGRDWGPETLTSNTMMKARRAARTCQNCRVYEYGWWESGGSL